MAPAGTKMPEYTPQKNYCGTHATGWMAGSHPSHPGESVTRKVCFNYAGKKCWMETSITVTNCINYYVYKLPVAPWCSLRYCAE